MDYHTGANHKFRNLLQTFFLLMAMSMLLAWISRLILGPQLWPWVFITLLFLVLSLPKISPYWILKLYQARPIDPRQSPPLYLLVNELGNRAGLKHKPDIYWIPSQTLNAFAVGTSKNSAIAITDGLLNLLNSRELAAVLAHEISHIKNNDLRLLMLADIFTRLTYYLSLIGVLTSLIALPWIVTGSIHISVAGLLLLMITPAVSALLQLGLSRVREFNADLDAARITQDPDSLAQALFKIDQQNISPWQRILLPGYREYQPSILRTHPDTRERIKRLQSLNGGHYTEHQVFNPNINASSFHPYSHIHPLSPRQRFFTGIWR
jgi:heat shock protein HtpX